MKADESVFHYPCHPGEMIFAQKGGGGWGGEQRGARGPHAQANAVVTLPNDSILAVGQTYDGATGYDFALAKYLANGNLDTTFGNGGLVTTDFLGFDDKAQAVALLPNGNIVVAGTAFNPASGNYFALVEYSPQGQLDSSFGNGGLATTDFFGGGDD